MPVRSRPPGVARRLVLVAAWLLACTASDRPSAGTPEDRVGAASQALAGSLVVSADYPIDDPVPIPGRPGNTLRVVYAGSVGLVVWEAATQGSVRAQRLDATGHPVGQIYEFPVPFTFYFDVAATNTTFGIAMRRTQDIQVVRIRASDGVQLPSSYVWLSNQWYEPHIASDGTDFLVGTGYGGSGLSPSFATIVRVSGDASTPDGSTLTLGEGTDMDLVGTPAGYRVLVYEFHAGTPRCTAYGVAPNGTVRDTPAPISLPGSNTLQDVAATDGTTDAFAFVVGYDQRLLFFDHATGALVGDRTITLAPPGTTVSGRALLARGRHFTLLWTRSDGAATGSDLQYATFAADGTLETPPTLFLARAEDQEGVAATTLAGAPYLVTADRGPAGRHLVGTRFSAGAFPPAPVETLDLALSWNNAHAPAVAAAGDTLLFAWEDDRDADTNARDIYVRRLSVSTGRPLDPSPVLLAGGTALQRAPTIATDGRVFRLAWIEGNHVATVAMAPDGTVGTVATTADSTSSVGPPFGVLAASAGGTFLLAYGKGAFQATWQVVRIRPDGTLDAPVDTVGGGLIGALVGTSAGAVLALNQSTANSNSTLLGMRVLSDGTVVERPPFTIVPSTYVQPIFQPAGVGVGADAFVGWFTNSAGQLTANATRISVLDGSRTGNMIVGTASLRGGAGLSLPPRFVDDGRQLYLLGAVSASQTTFDLQAFGVLPDPASDGTSKVVWAGVGGTDLTAVGLGNGRSIVVTSPPGAYGAHLTFRALGAPAPAPASVAATAHEGSSTFVAIPGAGAGIDVEIVSGPNHGTATATAGGLTYRGDDGVPIPDRITYRLRNWLIGSATATVELDVLERRPTVSAPEIALDADAAGGATATLTGTSSGRPLTYHLATPPAHGTATIDGTSVTYVPDPGFSGTDTFTVTAADGVQTSAPATVVVTVRHVNHPPVLAPCDAAVDEDGRLAFRLAATDADGDALSITTVARPTHGTLTGTAPDFTFVPDADFSGADAVTFRASDASASSPDVVCHLTVRPVNDAPAVTAPALATDEDVPVSATLTATDAEHDPVTWSVVAPPAHGTLSGTLPALSYAPAAGFFGQDAFTVRASDGTAKTDAVVAVTVRHVNHAPELLAPTFSTPEDTVLDAVLAAADRDGDPVSFALVTLPDLGTATLSAAGRLHFVPPPDFWGPVSFQVSATDPGGLGTTVVVTLDVLPVNDPPTATGFALQTPEDTPVAFAFRGADPDGDTLAYLVETPPAHGRLAAGPGGFSYVPAADFAGADLFTYKATDGAATSAPVTITVRVLPVNDAPIATAAALVGSEDTPLPVTLAARDPEGDALTFVVTQAPAHGTLTGTPPDLTYRPAADFAGSDAFAFTATDGQLTSAAATVTLTLRPVPDAPVAAPRQVATTEDTPVDVALAGTDADGDALTFEVVTPPALGRLEGTPPALVYVPAPDATGTDRFTYRASDGLLTGAAAEVAIAIAPVNDAPVATAATFATSRRAAVELTLAAGDVDGDVLSFAVVEPPLHGTLTPLSGARFAYEPATAFHGTDRFTFTASDGEATSAPAEVLVNVGLDNQAPAALAATVTTNEDTAVDVPLAGRDAESDPLEIHVVVAPQHGTLEGSTAAWRYVPAADFHGEDAVVFTVDDGMATSAPATVTIVVAPVNDTPTTADAAASSAGEAVTVTLAGSDVDGDVLTWAVEAAPGHGTATIDGARLTYAPAAGFSGEEAIAFVVRDPAGAGARGTVRVTVTAAPVVVETPDAGSAPATPPTGCGCGALPAGWAALAVVFARRRRR